jgi:hypothetical protein
VRRDRAVVDPALHFLELLGADAAGGHLREALALQPEHELAVRVARGHVGAASAGTRRDEALRVADRVALEKRETAGLAGTGAVPAHARRIDDVALDAGERIGADLERVAAGLLVGAHDRALRRERFQRCAVAEMRVEGDA